MKSILAKFIFSLCLLSVTPVFAQLSQNGTSVPSKFRSDFLAKKQQQNKRTYCGVDTLYYSRYNATNFNYINIVPSGSSPVLGAGLRFNVDDTVWLHGVNFYAYAMLNSTPVNVRVYYANATNNRPAGLPIATVSKTLNTGFPIWVAPNLQKVVFSTPIMMVTDFVITIETTNSTTIVMACNDWLSGDGLGQNISSIKVSTGWATSINVGGAAFDADFYIEPVVEYNLTAKFEPGPTSCIGNGLPFQFINTTTHALNPQFSYEKLDGTLADNFIWDYGDGSPTEAKINGQNTYTSVASYPVNLDATFNTWTGTCLDDTTILVEEPTLNANFSSSAKGLVVNFTDKSTDAKQWSWNFGDGTNGSVSKNPTHIYSNYGTYPVKLTVRNGGCEAQTTLTIVLKEEPNGVEDQSSNFDFSIVPNPAQEFINISFSNAPTQDVEWSIFSIHGKIVSSGISKNEERINVSGLGKGVYFMNVKSGDQTRTQRLVVK